MADRTVVLSQNGRHAVRGLSVNNPSEFSAYQDDDDDLTYIVDMSSYLDGATITLVTRVPEGITITNTSNTSTRITQRLRGFGYVDFRVLTSSGDVEEFRINVLRRTGSKVVLGGSSGGGANFTPGDYGDITVSGSGGTTWTIDADAVTTAKIADGAVTAGKIGDAELSALAGLTSAANKLPYFTGSGTAALADLTVAGRDLIAGADATAQRGTLGLGTIATQAANNVSITGGSITNITDLAIADGGTGASTAANARTNLGLTAAATNTVEQEYDTVAAVNSATIDSSINHIRTAGYYAAGDGGGALYKRVATPSPVKGYHLTSNGGTIYWELAEPMPNVLMLGAKGDGSTDDSAAFQNTLTYATDKGRYHVIIPGATVPTQNYKIKNVDIPSTVSVTGYGAFVKDTGLTGVNYIFKLSGFHTRLQGVYITSALNCNASNAAVVLETGTGMALRDVTIVNAVNGVKIEAAASQECKEFTLDNIRVSSFSGKGFWLGARANEGNFIACHADAETSAGTGGYRPKTGSDGFFADATGSGAIAFGGHQYVNCLAINCQNGYNLAYTQLSLFSNIVADACSGAGIRIGSVNACNNLHFSNVFIGYCGRGVHASSASTTRVIFSQLHTSNVGSIPPGGGTDFYSHAAQYSSPWYDIAQDSTAYIAVNVDEWTAFGTNAYSILEATTNYIQTLGGREYQFNSEGTIAAGLTRFLGHAGAKDAAGELDTVQQLPLGKSFILHPSRILVYTGAAPGAGQSYTYTVRDSGVDTALTATQTGTGVFTATFSGNPHTFASGDNTSIKVVTSAGAATTAFRGTFQLWPKVS